MRVVSTISLGYNSVYLVEREGERVLIDAGPDFEGGWPLLSDALAGRRPDSVVITHGHLDHAGLGARWKRERVPISMGAGDVHLASGPALATDAEWTVLVQFVEECGAPVDVARGAIEGLSQRRQWALQAASDSSYRPAGRDGRWPTGLRYEPFDGIRTVEDGELIGADLRALECPGHTPGNLVLVDEHEGWLFSGDQLLPAITPTPAIQVDVAGEHPTRFRSLPAFLASLQRLRAMEFERCYPGHGDPFEDVRAVIDANLAQIDQRGERMLHLLRARPRTTYELAEALYPRALVRRFWQIIATVQGQLDVLEDRGQITRAGLDWELRG